MVANSIKPDDDLSVLSGNNLTEDGGTSLILKIPINCSSVNPGGVLKKCKIWKIYFSKLVLMKKIMVKNKITTDFDD